MKQTAVEWLFGELQKLEHARNYESLNGKDYMERKYKVFDEAKEMEKKEILRAFNNGFSTINWDKIKENKAEQYYNKTFKIIIK